GPASVPMTPAQLADAIDQLTPAEACADYDHPNLRAWRAIRQGPGDRQLVAVFLDRIDRLDPDADAAQRRLFELAQTSPLPTEVPGNRCGAVLDGLEAATSRLLATVRAHTSVLGQASLLPDWSRVNVLGHLRYVTEALVRITDGALAGRPEDMYPGGREQMR